MWIDGEESHDVPLRVCNKQDHEAFHTANEVDSNRIKKHREVNQLLCPCDGSKDGIYGSHFTEKASNLKIFFRPCDNDKLLPGEPKCEAEGSRELNLEGKTIVLILNKQELVLTPEHDVLVGKFTHIEHIPFTRD